MAKRYLRAAKVAERYDTTASTIRRWARDPRFAHIGFPKSIEISPGIAAWDVDELDAYDARRIALRDTTKAA